jgi:molybdenum cofactor synthesis domain-containing protein
LSVEPERAPRVAILTVSDSVSAGRTEDRSGKNLVARCAELKWQVVSRAICADDRPAIEAFLKETCDAHAVDVILTTGGTGLGPRDVTP